MEISVKMIKYLLLKYLVELVVMTTPSILSTDWSTRVKQIAKLWRKASSQDRAPYVVRSLANVTLGQLQVLWAAGSLQIPVYQQFDWP